MHCANWKNPDSEYTMILFIWNYNIYGKGGNTGQQKTGCQELKLKMDLECWGAGKDFRSGRVTELFLIMVSATWPCAFVRDFYFLLLDMWLNVLMWPSINKDWRMEMLSTCFGRISCCNHFGKPLGIPW